MGIHSKTESSIYYLWKNYTSLDEYIVKTTWSQKHLFVQSRIWIMKLKSCPEICTRNMHLHITLYRNIHHQWNTKLGLATSWIQIEDHETKQKQRDLKTSANLTAPLFTNRLKKQTSPYYREQDHAQKIITYLMRRGARIWQSPIF